MSIVAFSQKPSAHLTTHLAPSLTQSLTILQLPILELSVWLQKQLEENPLVELASESSAPSDTRVIESKGVVEQRDFYKEKNLADHLESQARLFFHDAKELRKALDLLAELDEKGYLPSDTPDSATVNSLQLFDPPGICARSLQESLLLQLKAKGLHHSLGYAMIQEHFEDLLHHRLSKIRKQLGCTYEQLYDALHEEIASLSTNLADRFSFSETLLPIPDLSLQEEDGVWRVEVNRSYLPRVRLCTRLFAQPNDGETANYLRHRYKEAQQLLQAVRKRNATLSRLGHLLLRTQGAFLEGRTNRPNHLTISEAAGELKLHPATIARAVANKYVNCAFCGIVPLKFFFCRSSCSNTFDLGEAIASAIAQENSLQPLSDEQIAKKLRVCGVVCARRTVAKYRKLRQIPAAAMRKNRMR